MQSLMHLRLLVRAVKLNQRKINTCSELINERVFGAELESVKRRERGKGVSVFDLTDCNKIKARAMFALALSFWKRKALCCF